MTEVTYKDIKIETVIDKRFVKISKFNNERFKLKFSHLYSEQLHNEYIRLLNGILSYLNGESISIVSKKYKISKDSLRTYTRFILEAKDMNYVLKSNIGYQGELGLDMAMTELKIFKELNKRLPRQREMNAIVKCIYKKHYWIEYDINTWNDLLKKTFGQVNAEKSILSNDDGLMIAKQAIIAYYNEHGKPPTARIEEMVQYVNFISRKKWIDNGIASWNDLLEFSIGVVNKKDKIYIGEQGLKKAKNKLQQYYKINQSKPKATDEGMLSIATAIKRKYWVDFDINTWSDLITCVFGKPNRKYGIWTGKQGLERAKQTIQNFYDQHHRRPRNRDKGMAGIVGSIKRKYWVNFGIHSWTQLLDTIFKENIQK